MPPRLLRKAEVAEEDEGADREHPAAHLQRDGNLGVCAPDDSGDLLDDGEVEVGVVPPQPGVQRAVDSVGVELVHAEGDREDDLRHSERHKSVITADGECAASLQELAELGVTLQEHDEGEDWNKATQNGELAQNGRNSLQYTEDIMPMRMGHM